MKKISHIFDPLMAMFKIDYDKRLVGMLQLDLYEAKKVYFKAIQMKQHSDTQLVHAETRVNTLTELLAKQKVTGYVKNNYSATIDVTPTYPTGSR